MIAPPVKIIQDRLPAEPLVVLFRIISRKSWEQLQALHEAFPGSSIEHVLYGIYVLKLSQAMSEGWPNDAPR